MDDTARKPSGGVRNLRAMFENRDNGEESTGSPQPKPTRGYSGAADSAAATQSPGPRPLNKVQMNFVAVEQTSKSGTIQWGLKQNTTSTTTTAASDPTSSTPDTTATDTDTPSNKDDSENITLENNTESVNNKENTHTTEDNLISPPLNQEMPRRRNSFSLHDELPNDHKTIQERKASIAEEFRNRAHSIQIGAQDGPIPEFAVETPALETPVVDGHRYAHQLGYSEPPIPGTSANPDKPTNDNQPGVQLNPGDPKSKDAVTDGKALEGASFRGLTGGDAKSMRDAAARGLKATPGKATLALREVVPSPGSSSRFPAHAASSSVSKPLRSPPLQKTPVSAAASQRNAAAGSRNVSNASTFSTASTAKPTAKAAPSATNGTPKTTTSSAARSSAAAPTASQAAKKAPAGASAPSTSGAPFHKPRSKSPTRPARLPSSLLAPTASSISKVAGAENNTATQSRRLSQGALAANKAASTTKVRNETLKHTTSHNRPSTGLPPSSAAHKKPATSSTSKPAEDSFLARMMRPTAASSGRIVSHQDEKSHPSPPKPKAATPAHSRPATREKLLTVKKDDTPKKAEQKTEPERPQLTDNISEPISPKTEAPLEMESKSDAMKTEVPSTSQESHGDMTPANQEPHVESSKPSLPSHYVPKVDKTERTVSITDMENSDGTFKKLKPGEIPIPKIAKKKKKPQPIAVEGHKKVSEAPRSPRPAVSEVPKEKKRDFLLEVREEEKRHRRMSERPSIVKNPSSIPEVTEPEDEELDDHQLPSGSSGDDRDVSGSSTDTPRATARKIPSPKKPVSPAKTPSAALEENAIESQNMSPTDVDNVDIVTGPSASDVDAITTRRLSATAEKAMDYAAEAVDKATEAVDEALKHKVSAAEMAEKADKAEAPALQSLSKDHGLTSAMLNGSALDTDDEYTPSPSEKKNPFEDAGEKKESSAEEFVVKPELKEGEEKVVEERSKVPLEEETAKEGEADDKVGDVDVTALAS